MKDRTITDHLMQEFARSLAMDEKSTATREKYLRDVSGFRAWLGNTAPDKESCLRYKQHLLDRYQRTSVNSMLASMNAFFRFAGWQELFLRQVRIQKKAYCSAEKELSKEEYRRLITAARSRGDSRLELLLQTICSTGIRVSELRTITVEAVKRGEALVSCKAKTRPVFLVSGLQKKLLRYAKQLGIRGGCIFITGTGKPLDRSNIWRMMKSLCADARVSPEKVFPHNLRHLFARTFYALEKDIAKLADILGHANINTTRIYMITTGVEHRQKMERMHLLL